MTKCHAEQSYPLNDVQRQRLALESQLGGWSMSWLIIGATIRGVTDLARFHDALLELPRVYPVLRTTLVTAGPPESWYQDIRSCDDLFRGREPVVQLPGVNSWGRLVEAMSENLESRSPDYRYSAAYSLDEAGCLRVAFMFDHMAFDIRSIEVILAHLARTAGNVAGAKGAAGRDGGDGGDQARACGCGNNEFAPYVRRNIAAVESVDLTQELPERYEWALELMLAARSPHAYVSLPVARPLSVLDGGGAQGFRSRFVTDAGRKHIYTPFAAFVSALALSLETNFESPALLYSPSLNRLPAEMGAAGWFSGTPILPVRAQQIKAAVAGERILDEVRATAEVRAANTQTSQDGELLTALIHRKLSTALGGRTPFLDCTAESQPYIVLGYADSVRERTEWKANDVVVKKVRLPGAALPSSPVPPGYIYIRLRRAKKAEWSVDAIYEKERYENGAIETLLSTTERYLRQLL